MAKFTTKKKPVEKKKVLLRMGNTRKESVLKQAIDGSLRIDVKYRRMNDGNIAERILEPYEIKTHNSRNYLYAEDVKDTFDDRHIKKYLIHNFHYVSLTDEKFEKKIF